MRISDWSSDVCSSDLAPLVNGLAEEHASRLVAHADVDADLLPLALQHLLHQLAHAAAGGGHEPELPRLPLGVVADAAAQLGPAGGVAPQIGRAACRERGCQYV